MVMKDQTKAQVFEPNNITLFMGGDFKIPDHVKNVSQLRDALIDWVDELNGWFDVREETSPEIGEICMAHGIMRVTLEEGIAQ
jgi:hypothetical protein